MLLFSQIMYLARRWAQMRRIMVLGPWVWGGWSSPKYFSPPGSLPDPSPVILSTAVFDCRTFQLNKGKHQCFAKGLKKKKKNPWKLLSQHPQQACCGYSSHCATSLCSRLSPSQPPVTASQPLRTFIPGQGPPHHRPSFAFQHSSRVSCLKQGPDKIQFF